MTKINIYYLVWLFSVFIASFSQVLLKIAARKEYPSKIGEYLNPLVITAYVILFASMLLTLFALREGHNVKYVYSTIIQSMEYIFIPILGYFMLKEKIGKRRLLGIAVIIAGVLIFAL